MVCSGNDYINKLIYELKLHDANIISVKLSNNNLDFCVSCEGMGINYYFNDLDNVYFNFCVEEIKKISFEFHGDIAINDFSIIKEDKKYILKTDNNDFYVECLHLKIEVSKIKCYENEFKSLDDFLKSDI